MDARVRMRSLTVGSLALVALLLLPGAQAGTLIEAEGKWYWNAEGTVGVSGLPGLDSRVTIFLDEGVQYYRVTFDPVGVTYLQCLNGEGFLSMAGVRVGAASCSLELNGAYAVPRATIASADLGQLPGQVGHYLGPLRESPGGSGAYRIA